MRCIVSSRIPPVSRAGPAEKLANRRPSPQSGEARQRLGLRHGAVESRAARTTGIGGTIGRVQQIAKAAFASPDQAWSGLLPPALGTIAPLCYKPTALFSGSAGAASILLRSGSSNNS